VSFSSFNFGANPGSTMRFATTRGRINGSFVNGVNYPSPFFDVAHTYLPTTVKQMFRFCRYYFLTNPLINATVFKLSEYPVTDIIVDHEDKQVKKRWTEYFHDHLHYRAFQVESGLDYHAFGNCAVSLSFPFHKYISCRVCQWTERADKTRNYWTFTNFDFRLTCPRCGHTADAIAQDHYYPNASGIRIVRWNVEDIEINYNDLTGQSTYFYTIPGPLQSDIVIGKKDVVESVPQIFLQALRQRKGIVFSKENFFHLKRPTLAWQDRGWGIPLLLPVLKDTFYLQMMKKAQEAVLLEHIVPLRVIFPQAASGTSDPFTTLNLTDWRDQVAAEIARWRFDQNYIPIMPIPLGQQSIGGDGKALLLFQELQALSEHIIMGMGVPREFLMGGLSYAGTNVSMRMLENAFLTYISRGRIMARWVMKMVANYMGWPEANIRFKPFKMADDLQRKAYLFQLNQAGKISDTTLLTDADLDQSEENEIMASEADKRVEGQRKQQIAMAEIQGEAQLIMMKYQAKAQEAMTVAAAGQVAPGEPGGPEGAMSVGDASAQAGGAGSIPGAVAGPQPLGMGARLAPGSKGQPGTEVGADMNMMAQGFAQQIASMQPNDQQLALQALQAQSPELAQLVQQYMGTLEKTEQSAEAGVDMRPLPNKLPPRRLAAAV
jgi:hypothetical protein